MGKATIIFWDVQHGSSTYIQSPSGKHIMIDLGSGSYSGKNNFSPLTRLKQRNINRLDYLIITHPHKDHIDDILNLNAKPKAFRRPRHLDMDTVIENSRDFGGYKEKISLYKAFDDSYKRPKVHNLGGLKMTSFTPKNCLQSNLNNHSIITVIEYAGYKIVVPGDNEECSFKELMRQSRFRLTVKNADILLAAHHGRKNGFYENFVKLVNPKLTIISDTERYKNEVEKESKSEMIDRYVDYSSGLEVRYKVDDITHFKSEKCLTTYRDGAIRVVLGNEENKAPYIKVSAKRAKNALK